jgi:hypothetical protein
MPIPKFQPLNNVSPDTLKNMSPGDAIARGQQADEQLKDFHDRVKTMSQGQAQAEMRDIAANKMAQMQFQTGQVPAELMHKFATNTPLSEDDLKQFMQTPAGGEIAQHAESQGFDPFHALAQFFGDKDRPPWQKMLAAIGFPLALGGIASSLFGGGGVMGMLTGLLGLGAGAAGLDMFGGGEGPLSGIGAKLLGMLGLSGGPSAPKTAPAAPQGQSPQPAQFSQSGAPTGANTGPAAPPPSPVAANTAAPSAPLGPGGAPGAGGPPSGEYTPPAGTIGAKIPPMFWHANEADQLDAMHRMIQQGIITPDKLKEFDDSKWWYDQAQNWNAGGVLDGTIKQQVTQAAQEHGLTPDQLMHMIKLWGNYRAAYPQRPQQT